MLIHLRSTFKFNTVFYYEYSNHENFHRMIKFFQAPLFGYLWSQLRSLRICKCGGLARSCLLERRSFKTCSLSGSCWCGAAFVLPDGETISGPLFGVVVSSDIVLVVVSVADTKRLWTCRFRSRSFDLHACSVCRLKECAFCRSCDPGKWQNGCDIRGTCNGSCY